MIKCYQCYWESENEEFCDRCGSDLREQQTREEQRNQTAGIVNRPRRKSYAGRIVFFIISIGCLVCIEPLQQYARHFGERYSVGAIAGVVMVALVALFFAVKPSKKR